MKIQHQTCNRVHPRSKKALRIVFCNNSVQIWLSQKKNSFLTHGDWTSLGSCFFYLLTYLCLTDSECTNSKIQIFEQSVKFRVSVDISGSSR
jgi:hypothetical protein